MIRRPGLRRRITWTLIGVIVATVLGVGTVSVLLVDRALRGRLVEEALRGAEFNLTVLVPAVGLEATSSRQEIEASGVVERFLGRGTAGVAIELGESEMLAAGVVPASFSPRLRQIVDAGELGYEFADTPRGSVLVTAARLPETGPAFYFVTPAQQIDEAVRQLVLVVSGVGLGAIVLGAVAARALAGGILQPVAAARAAAEEMADGELSTRLEVEGSDEFGSLSASFNRMARSLEQTIAELERAQTRERQFVADVSHELRTPLTAMVNAARLLKDRLAGDVEVTDDHRTVATMLDADVSRLRHLVDELLEMSRLDSGGASPRLGPVDVGAFLRALIAERHPGARLVGAPSSPVTADRSALERIIGNFLDNARLHAPGAETTVAAALDDGALVVEVADRGPGVEPAMLERLFDRFATADSSRGSGTGLGLAIAAGHARSLGGDVEARLRTGGGMAVRVRLPVVESLHDGEVDAISSVQGVDDNPKGDQT